MAAKECREFCDGTASENTTGRGITGVYSENRSDWNHKPTNRCSIHRKKYKYYCTQCRCCLCGVCVNGIHPEIAPTHPEHDTLDILSMTDILSKIKRELMKMMESMSTMLNSLDYYDSDLDNQKLTLEFAWLARKHEIQQEFVSFHSMLIDREQELITKMEQDVEKALAEMSDLKQMKQKLEQEEIIISDECLSFVKEKKCELESAIKEQEMLTNKCKQLVNKVELVPTAEDLWPQYLKMPFSMYAEKLHLNQALQSTGLDCYISAKEQVKYIPLAQISNPVLCSDLIYTLESFPPSTSCTYDVEIHTPSSLPVSYTALSMHSCIFENDGGKGFQPNTCYFVVFQPVFSSVGNHGNRTVVRGDKVCVMISTESTEISVREPIKSIPLSEIKDPVLCEDLICMNKILPPSMTCTYYDVVTWNKGTFFSIKSYSSVSKDFCLFNNGETDLEASTSYTVEFYPLLTCVDRQGHTSVIKDKRLCVILQTESTEISVREPIKFIPLSEIKDPVLCEDLICMNNILPPSMTCTYDVVTRKKGTMFSIKSYSSVSKDFCLFNNGETDLEPATSYTVKFCPLLTCVDRQGHTSVIKDRRLCVTLQTESTEISVRETIRSIPLSEIKDPVLCEDLICMNKILPPSMTCTYDVEIRIHTIFPIKSYSSVSKDFCLFNNGETHLERATSYTVKFCPLLTCVDRQGHTSVIKDKCLCVTLQTESTEISVREPIKSIPLAQIKDPVLCEDLICMNKILPPSMTFTYDVVIQKKGNLFSIKSYSSVSKDFCLFNNGETDLEPATSYTVKFCPLLTCVDRQGHTSVIKDKCLCVTLQTGMCCLVCEKVHIKDSLLLIKKSSLCGGTGFPLKKFRIHPW